MIEVEGLTRYYGRHAAVDHLSFRAEKGEILGFLGPNGAGKTTTMRMLTCYLPPSSGTARVAGYDILDQSIEVRRRIGYLPENVPLYRDLTVTDYLDFVGRLKGMPGNERGRRMARVIEECGVGEVQHKPVGTLSRGYRQRVGLAQALINDPDVLILDEPTVGLDPRQIVEIRELIRGLAGERTVILSTHILPEVSLVCQRVIIINRGELISDDTPERLGHSVPHARTIELEVRGDDAQRIAAMLAGVDGVSAAAHTATRNGVHFFHVESSQEQDPREAIAALVVGGGMGLISLKSADISLEDVFVHLVTEEPATDA